MKIKCIIVDDEPLAQRVLEKYISSLSSIELSKKCNNALEAMAFLHNNSIDIMFLDIKMPELTGIEMLKTLPHSPAVIITTAYSEYALEGYEYSVTDYLLKPFSFERFLKAVNKVISKKSADLPVEVPQEKVIVDDFIFVRADKTDHKIMFSEIYYIEGCGNYIKIFLRNKMLMVSETMTTIEKNLPSNIFIRVHKSFIVSIKKINEIRGNLITIGKTNIPIGSTYKIHINQVLEKYNIKK